MTNNEKQNTLPQGSTLQGGRYTIEGLLGTGGFGITYRARDVRLARTVAIKELFPSGCARHESTVTLGGHYTQERWGRAVGTFLREAQILADLDHPCIVPVYDQFNENNTAYMVMKFIEGVTVAELVARDGPVPEEKALDYALSLGDALTELHKRKVLHRDIKPSNVIVTRAGLPTLLDFGAAREFINDPDVSHTLVGTMGYAAPEQFYSRQAQGPFTDVYGLAATLYFLLTGTSPRLADHHDDVYLSPRVQKGLERGLAFYPNERPQDIATFIAELQGLTKPSDRPTPAPATQATIVPDLVTNEDNIPQTYQLPRITHPQKIDDEIKTELLPRKPSESEDQTVSASLAAQTLPPSQESSSAASFIQAESEPPGHMQPSIDARTRPQPLRDKRSLLPTSSWLVWLLLLLGGGLGAWTLLTMMSSQATSPASADLTTPTTTATQQASASVETPTRRVAATPVSTSTRLSKPTLQPRPFSVENIKDVVLQTSRNVNARRILAYSVDGAYVIDGGDIVKMYNHALDEVASYNPRGSANSVAVSPDGRTVAIATDTGSVLLWDMADIPSTTQSATPVARSLIENAAPMASVAFSPDGKTLAASSIDGLVRLWEVSDGATREIKTIAPLYSPTPATPTGTREVYPDNILPLDYQLTFSPEGKTLAFVEPDGLVVFRDLVYSHSTPGTGGIRYYSKVRSLVFHPRNGDILALGSEDGTISVRDLSSNTAPRFGSHTGRAFSLSFSPDGTILASGGEDHKVHLWSVESGDLLRTLNDSRHAIFGVRFSPDGGSLAVGSIDGSIRIYSLPSDTATRVP